MFLVKTSPKHGLFCFSHPCCPSYLCACSSLISFVSCSLCYFSCSSCFWPLETSAARARTSTHPDSWLKLHTPAWSHSPGPCSASCRSPRLGRQLPTYDVPLKEPVDDSGEQGHIGENCPYWWTNSIDEEDDQGSSWESEPEAEGSEELASLKAPDDEGGWFWPKGNRISCWRKRADPSPTFDYLAEDDEEEHVPGGLNHLVQLNAVGAQ